MRRIAGSELRDWVEDAAVMGFVEVIKRYGWFKERFAEMLAEVRRVQPKVLLLVDYPGFNLRFAEAVKKELPETKIVYYISPQVWAWNRKRIPKMARLLDEMLCLFPFEKPIFEQAGLKTTFVGHPLVDELEEERISVSREHDLVALLPGSREREVSRLFPMMLESARLLSQQHPGLRFQAPAASPKLGTRMHQMAQESGLEKIVHITAGGAHELMQRAGCGVVASGTATLEAACFGLPYCLVYKMAWPTYLLGRLLVKIRFIGLINILADRLLATELIQHEANPKRVSAILDGFIRNPASRENLSRELLLAAALLGGPGAHRRAAEAVDRWLREPTA
jgi:lipid-A-disaccharide synthase